MTATRPRLSLAVALCTYQGSAHLGAQLESIARQERLPDLLVVVDDASSDSSVRIAREFAGAAPFPVRVETNARNLGFAANFGRAIALADGDVVVLCDQDDVWHPARLARLDRAFTDAPEAGLVFSDAELVDAELAPMGSSLWDSVGFTPDDRREVLQGRAFELLLRRAFVTGATLAFRSRFRDRVLPIPPGVEHDAWCSLVVAAFAPLVPLPEPLVRYRQHGGNAIGAQPGGRLRRVRRALAGTGHEAGLRARHTRNAAAASRLAEWGADPALVQALRASVEHLAVRMGISARPRAARLRPIARELARRRYARCSQGVLSAIRDLCVPAP